MITTIITTTFAITTSTISMRIATKDDDSEEHEIKTTTRTAHPKKDTAGRLTTLTTKKQTQGATALQKLIVADERQDP